MSEFHVRDQRRPGHHWADNEIMDEYCKLIGMRGYAIYMYLCRWAGNRSGQCCKRQSEISDTFNSSQDTVQRYLEKLKECGLISIENRVGLPSVFTLLEVPKLPQKAAPYLPQKAVTLPQIAVDLPQKAAHNKEERLFEDYINTKPKELPEWIELQTWSDFEEMRKKIKKPMTDRAKKSIITELDKLRGRGHPANEVLEQSIRNCWQDVFELRDKSNGTGQTTKAERRNADISETTRKVFDPARHIPGYNAKGLPDKTSG